MVSLQDYYESPCIRKCTQGPVCQGCMRRREEIDGWLDMTPAEQLRVLLRLSEDENRGAH